MFLTPDNLLFLYLLRHDAYYNFMSRAEGRESKCIWVGAGNHGFLGSYSEF